MTGASGFIGSEVCTQLVRQGHHVRATYRGRMPAERHGIDWREAELSAPTPWKPLLEDVDTVVHLAGRAHVLHETASDPAAAFRRANVDPVAHMLEAIGPSTPLHIVLVSSIGVNGNVSGSEPFRADDEPAPVDVYAKSKLAAERLVVRAAERGELKFTIVRPTLVYGPGAPGNFARLLRLVRSGLPLPLASVANKRSLISVNHLAGFLVRVCEDARAQGRLFLVADGTVVSTPRILEAIATGLGRRPRLFPFPPVMLGHAARLVGRGHLWEKLSGDLQVDAAPMREVLDWRPQHDTYEGIIDAVRGAPQ